MTKENINITKEDGLSSDNMIQFLVAKSRKIFKKDFAKFSALIAIFFSMGLWVIKTAWYVYMFGKFSVYKIDNCYIDVGGDSIFLQIIQMGLITIIFAFSNIVLYKILIDRDKLKSCWNKMRNVLGFCVVEMIVLGIGTMIFDNISLIDLICKSTIETFVSFIGILFLVVFIINIFAIVFLCERLWTGKMAKKANAQENIDRESKVQIKSVVYVVILSIAIESLVIFCSARNKELNRCDYKIIMIQSEDVEKSKFDIEYRKDNKNYKIYPVAYENQDCYIITRLYNENGEIKIDYQYQKVIEKDGQETIYVDNVYKICGDS